VSDRTGASSHADLARKRLAEAAVLFAEGVQFCLEGCPEFTERLVRGLLGHRPAQRYPAGLASRSAPVDLGA
jgi:hypothetical protein